MMENNLTKPDIRLPPPAVLTKIPPGLSTQKWDRLKE
jgi:hypothetical protein